MDKEKNFARNLEALLKLKGKSVYETSEEISIPESTLRDAMKSGCMTLHTAIRISEGLNVSIDQLLSEELDAAEYDQALRLLNGLECFSKFSPDKQDEIRSAFCKLLGLLCTREE